jgi:hypothetical protein
MLSKDRCTCHPPNPQIWEFAISILGFSSAVMLKDENSKIRKTAAVCDLLLGQVDQIAVLFVEDSRPHLS